jgi:hypothetical protein
MSKELYQIIAESIWRSGFIKDKNAVRQKAREKMRRLIAHDIGVSIKSKCPDFDIDEFIKNCYL